MDPLISVRSLRKEFPPKDGKETVVAVDDVSFDIMPGDTFGLAGPSPSGKSTIGRMILGLLKPSSGSVLIEGTDITTLDERAMRPSGGGCRSCSRTRSPASTRGRPSARASSCR